MKPFRIWKQGGRRPIAGSIVVAAFGVLLAACTPMHYYRSDLAPCASGVDAGMPADPKAKVTARPCARAALESAAVGDGAAYRLGVIEFDDQGHLFDRRQMRAVLDPLESAPPDEDLLMVVYAHGWKHNADGDPEDPDLRQFRRVLSQLARADVAIARHAPSARPRRIVGIYLAWRGLSIDLPLIKELTFWDRKSTAHKVGDVGVAEVLTRLDAIKSMRSMLPVSSASTAATPTGAPVTSLARARDAARTKLVVVGHSFGGAIVYSAISHLLEERFIATNCGPLAACDVTGFGDLVVLVNPAFEATRFSTLSDMQAERGSYFASQLPVMVVLTSEADQATRVAFPLGRYLSTLFEKERTYPRRNAWARRDERIDEGAANVTAIGHFAPYRTHRLVESPVEPRAGLQPLSPEALIRATEALRHAQEHDGENGARTLPFANLQLTREDNAAPRTPYLVVRVAKSLIHDHSDLSHPRMLDFVQALILEKSQRPEEMRAFVQAAPER